MINLKNFKLLKNANSKHTEDWIPIKEITNGMIVLDNNLNVSGVKIIPKNIFILDSATQEAVIRNLKNLYNILDFEFWIMVADRPVDINSYLAQLNVLYNSVTVPSRKKLIMDDIKKANSFMNNKVVDTEYFLLFKEKDPEIVFKKIRTIINGFADAGIMAKQVSNQDLRLLIDNFLNGGVTTDFGTVMF